MLRAYPAWDRVVRGWHWVNLACVVVLAGLGTALLWGAELGVTPAGKVLLKTTHVWAGYVFATALALRLGWAFAGSPRARWRAFAPRLTGLGAYLRAAATGTAPPYVGHNPLGRLMVGTLLLVLGVQALTGLVLAGTDIYYPPLGGWIAGWVAAPGVDPASLVPGDQSAVSPAAWRAMRAFRAPVVELHESLFFGLLGLVALHVAGVVVAELREGGALVSAMITGRKLLDHPPADAADDDR